MPTSSDRQASPSATVREQLTFSLHQVEESSYSYLNIVDMCRPDWTISYVLSGCVQTATGGDVFTAQAGEVMIHPPEVPFSEYSSSGGTHQWFACDIQMWPHLDLLQRNPVAPVVSLRAPDEYSRCFTMLENLWRNPSGGTRELRLMSLTLGLLSAVIESWMSSGSPRRPASMQTSGRFGDIVAYMTRHLDRKISRDELARAAHLHPGYFDRVFRTEYGMAPMQMLRDVRLRRAQELLESTDQTLDAIAQACGMGSAALFSRMFRARFGQTPGQYRQSAKQARESYLQSMEEKS